MLEILDPGLMTTVQDLGRVGMQQFGVSVGGAMDELALRAANALVGNAPGEAALEITIAGPRLRALDKCLIAVTGARLALTVNDNPMPLNTALFVRAGSTLAFGRREAGVRAYLALGGGLDVPRVLGSRSTDLRGQFGGMEGRALRAGDRLKPRLSEVRYDRAGRSLPDAFPAYYESTAPIRVLWGPHVEFFTEEARAEFLSRAFTVGDLSDRTGLRLLGSPIRREARELLSCGLTRGAIQVPPDGQPIVLMADHQTTGGYPIIATVIRADLPRLAQQVAGDRVAFREVSLSEAHAARSEMDHLVQSVSL